MAGKGLGEAVLRLKPKRIRAIRRWQEGIGHALMGALTWSLLGLLLAIGGVLLLRALPLLQNTSLTELLFSTTWQPMRGLFGMAPFLVGTLAVTMVAMLLAVPLAILSGIYLAEYMSRRARLFFKPVTDLLAGIPPVVYGLWGVLVIVPFVRNELAPWADRTLGGYLPFFANTNPSGYSIAAAGLVLSLMVYPIIVAVTEEVLRAVPRELREALFALGATRWEVTKVTLLRTGLPGVVAAVILGFSRAFGETLAVLMVVGNVARIPGSIFDGGYTLAGLIANNYGEMMSVPRYESALMGAALMLLLVVVSFNLGAWLFLTRRLPR
ncbi:MAG: phosphate ABC transporter permease subunit PstC [Candidatus Viridilinea halotolerans]|uniref:Phosphate transport system permease protein n=1 Tax=Candidatus Viridilinea halotolerans TaxID=2491704 RepID=A0A426TZM3_9CHLR|nr:MAG: phosphate ABC transporter permease subunit PstC [Candidatus Viridilinea halotolerans]